MFSEGYRTQRGVTGPMNLQKIIRIFFRKLVLQGYWDPGCHLNTLIDLANNALASNCFLDAICLFSEGYRNHRGVTVPMNFKKPDDFFFRNSCSLDFGDPGCHPDTLIDLANSDLASRDLVETICMICEGYRTHIGVTGPMNFKSRIFF